MRKPLSSIASAHPRAIRSADRSERRFLPLLRNTPRSARSFAANRRGGKSTDDSSLAKHYGFAKYRLAAMHEHAPITPHSDPPGKARAHRARSLPSARPFLVAVVFSSLHYLGLIGSLTALVSFLMRPGETAMRILVGGMVFSAITWLIAFFKRRATYCP